MSIYASTIDFDATSHVDECAKWVPCSEEQAKDGTYGAVAWHSDGRYSALIPDILCTCRAGPLAYQGSHILPADTDPRAGSFDLAEIPGFITRDGRGSRDEESPWPYLRVGVDDESRPETGGVVVVLDHRQVAELAEYLADWLDRVRAVPETKEAA